MLNIYWNFLCCESRIPIDDASPSPAGTGHPNCDDWDRFDKWAQIQRWRDWDGCPECDAPEPLIYGREFVIQ